MVLSRVVARQIGELNGGTLSSGLRGTISEEVIDGEHVAVSGLLECAGLKVSVGDLVMVPSAVGFVKRCVRDSNGRLLMVVALMEFIRTVTEHSLLFRETDDLDVFDPLVASMPRAWYPHDDDWVLVL